MTTSSIIKIIHEFEDAVGKEWVHDTVASIEDDVRRPKRLPAVEKEYHPLGYLFHQILPGLDTQSSDFCNTIRLAAIASQVIRTIQSGAQGVRDRIEKLKSKDHPEVRSTFYEFGVAAMLIDRHHEICFLDELTNAPGCRTPDILVDNGVEVECKQRGKTQKDGADQELWELFHRKSTRLLTANHRSCSVELFTENRPTRSDVDWAERQLRQSIRQADVWPIEVSGNGVYLVVSSIDTSSCEGGIAATTCKPSYPCGFEKVEIMAPICKNVMDSSKVIAFAIRCGSQQRNSRKTWVSNKLESARGQFSGERPAVVYLDLQLPLQNPSELDMHPASEAIGDWL